MCRTEMTYERQNRYDSSKLAIAERNVTLTLDDKLQRQCLTTVRPGNFNAIKLASNFLRETEHNPGGNTTVVFYLTSEI